MQLLRGRDIRSFCAFLVAICSVVVCVSARDAFAQPQTRPLVPGKSADASKAKPMPPANTKTPTKTVAPSSSLSATGDPQLTFSFRYQPWQQVLDWFAEQAGLSLLMDAPPPGTFNYTDTRSYTVPEALDVLNGVLLTKGYTLVRHGRMLVMVNLEDGIPPNLVPDVPLAELDKRGEYELIRVLFPVWNMTPEQAAGEVQPLLGPQGKVITLPQSRGIQVTETAGRLRTIRSIVNAVESPDSGAAGVREFPLHYITFDAAIPTIRQMLGISGEAFATPDGSVQLITKSAVGEKILFRGTAQQATRLTEILRLIDVPEAARGVNGAPQLEVYSVTTGDPDAVVKMLQTMLHDPTVILTSDKEAGHVLAFATPPQQATIRATIEQMQKEAKQVDVINLSNVDPQVAVVAINKLFGSNDDKVDPKAPRVDADLTTRSLLVRGTESQLKQIRDLLRKLGETEEEGGAAKAKQQHVRLLPLTGAAARSAISQIEQIWPNVRTNRIRIISPSSSIPSYRPGDTADNAGAAPGGAPPAATPADGANDQLLELWQNVMKDRGAAPSKPAQQPAQASPGAATPKKSDDRSARSETPSLFHFVADATQSNSPSAPKDQAGQPVSKTPQQPPPQAAPQRQGARGAPIVVAPGPGGTLIASDDLEALDQLEDLLTTVAGHNAASGREYAVFY